MRLAAFAIVIVGRASADCGDTLPGFTDTTVDSSELGCFTCPDDTSGGGISAEVSGCSGDNSEIVAGSKIFGENEGVACKLKCMYRCETTIGVGPCCAGLEGANCDVEIDACVRSPCDKDATCKDLPGKGPESDGRRCTCRPGFKGNGEACTVDKDGSTPLSQSDFDSGTYIIDTPGRYYLTENITFNPFPRSAGGNSLPKPEQLSSYNPPGKYDARAFNLGFFAAIVIQGNGIDVDLNGFTLEQGEEHSLFQRFFALIELSNVPFHYDNGPHNFTTDALLKSATFSRVHNGYLGRSTHHSLHGMAPKNIVLERLSMYDFEVAGISLNGAQDITIENCVIGPGRRDVPVVGLWSSGLFILPYVQKIVESTEQGCGSSSSITISNSEVSGAQILAELTQLQTDTYNFVVNKVGAEIPPAVTNLPKLNPVAGEDPRRGLPDGSAMYGIVLANYGSHTNGLTAERNSSTCLDANGEIVGMVDPLDTGDGWFRCEEDGAQFVATGNERITIKDVKVHGINVQVNEVAALKTKNWNKSQQNYDPIAQIDPVGAVYQYEANVDSVFGARGNFRGNPVSNAQLFVAKYLKMKQVDCRSDQTPDQTTGKCASSFEYQYNCFADKPNPDIAKTCPVTGQATSTLAPRCKMNQKGGDPADLQTELNLIRQETLDWAATGGPFTGEAQVICGGDNMFHVNKGVFGIRIDAGVGINLQNVEVDTVENFAQPGSSMCGDSMVNSHPASIQMHHYMGGDAVGVSIAGTQKVDFKNCAIRHVTSQNGNAHGIVILGNSDYISGTVAVGKLTTNHLAKSAGIPNFFKSRLPLRHDHAPPVAMPLHVQEYSCFPGDTMMDWMRMSGTDPSDMANMAAGGGDDDDILKPLEPGVDVITCSLVTQLEPIDGSKKLTFPVGSRTGIVDTSASAGGESGENGENGEGSSSGGVSQGAFVAVLIVFLILIAGVGAYGYKVKKGANPAQKLTNPSYQETGAIQMEPIPPPATEA